MKPIFLIGYMCSGKTTLGCALARALDVVFIDLDQEIERKTGLSVRQIFAQRGEAEFRRLERETLAEVSARGDAIVACGGGTPCQPGAMEAMNAAGVTVYLQPDMDRLIARLMDGRAARPLIAHIDDPEQMRAYAQQALAQRLKYYTNSTYTFDTTYLETPEEIQGTVDKFINQLWSTIHPHP